MKNFHAVILGSGIAGIAAADGLRRRNIPAVIFEKDDDWGGLCGHFSIGGFRFDRFVHFSFADRPETQKIFAESSPLHAHSPISSNYYHGHWLRHPAQNHLANLSCEEKVRIIRDFVNRPQYDSPQEIHHYGQWLEAQFGRYFAHHFPFAYTRKYWGVEPRQMGIGWIGNRMYSPNLEELLWGAFEHQEKNFYYTTAMNYPKSGGFRSILDDRRRGLEIHFRKKVVEIRPPSRQIRFDDGTIANYSRLISTLPLPEIIPMLPDVPEEIRKAAGNLRHTCGYQLSLGFCRPDVPKHLWFYIYDEDILPARVYSPSLKSPENAPANCSSIQAEIFFPNGIAIPPAEKIMDETIGRLIEMGIFASDDLQVRDIRFEPYANIIFDHNIDVHRKMVTDYLKIVGILTAGRFGKWDYFWTHQAFEDGQSVAEAIEEK